MKIFFVALVFVIFCQPLNLQAQEQPESDWVDQVMERVNRFKINNQNDSALYELITLNRTLKEQGRESGYVFIDIGNIYFQLKLDNMARTFYKKALVIFRESQDLIGESIVLENFGTLHARKPGSDSSFFYFNKALQLQQQEGDAIYAAHSRQALALYYSRKGQNKEAHAYLDDAMRALQEEAIKQHPRYRWDVQFIPQQVHLAAYEIYRHENKPDSAVYHLKKAIDMTRTYGIEAHRVRYLTFLGSFYLQQKQWNEAHEVIQQSLALAERIGYVWGKVGALQALRNYYHQTKDAAKEAEAAYNYLLYKDKMYNERNNDDLIIMSNLILQYENELEIARQQNLVQEKEQINAYQRKQNYLLLIILAVFAAGLASVALLYRSLQKKTKLVEKYSAEQAASNETMRTLLSVISHDVRSPFNSLLGLSKVTLMEKDLSQADYTVRINMMHDTASKGLILLDNLLQWVALQRDKVLIKKEKFDVPALVDETLHELSSVALTQHVALEQHIAAKEFVTDRNSTKVIVRNLLTNAIKYSLGKKVFLEITDSTGQLVIKVTDQGPGIPEEILNGLFQQGDMKNVAAKGSGLGMQIVKGLVADLGGTIEARNLAEGGAVFEVHLPSGT
jgi:signal transduction histidine kinase